MSGAATDTGSLAGRSAVVTGASRGIGFAIARALVARGARVAILARNQADLDASARILRELPAASADAPGPAERVLALACDVAAARDVERAIAAIAKFVDGAPDILVNNAGRFAVAAVERTEPAEFARALEINLVAPFTFVHALLAPMRARGSGHIVSIGSIADRTTFAGNGAYAAGKFGLRALHQVLREETRGTGVRVSLVSPGPVDTPLWDAIDTAGGNFTPRDRMLHASAVADAVCYVLEQPADVNVDELRLSRS